MENGMTYNVAVIVGSIRKDSVTRKLALAMAQLAPAALKLKFVEIADLPMFNQDLEQNPAPEAVRFKKEIREADAVLFATPEYNRSVPGVLKNAIDVASRPYGDSAWAGKPAAVISVSPGALGAFGANHHLRQSLVFLNMPTMGAPEAYISNIKTLMDDSGQITKPETREFLGTFLKSFNDWIGQNRANAKS